MIHLLLALVFLKIGLLTVGGGLAMIPLIRHEMLAHGWLTETEFLDIFGIAQMTPGPISVNAATFVGYQTVLHGGGSVPEAIAGATIATVAVSIPSFICIGILGNLWQKHRNHPAMVAIFKVMRPLVCGLVAAAAISMCLSCLKDAEAANPNYLFAPAIMLFSFALTAFTKFSPFAILLLGALAGFFLA